MQIRDGDRFINKFKRDNSETLKSYEENYGDEDESQNQEIPASPKSIESQTSSKSHDGVFLRPDAVQNTPLSIATSIASSTPTISALLSNRLVKRTSVDSGINLEPIRSTARTMKTSPRDQLTKLNRFDRSMSLPMSNSSSLLTFNSSNSITTAASLASAQAAASAAGIDSAIDSFSLSIDSAIDPHSFYSSGSNTSLSNASLLSPPRRLDFALCK